MAISSSLALGKVKGSMGGMTYSIVEGRTIVRQKPTHVRNPNTEAQQLQRGKMANAVRAFQIIGPMCAKTFTVRKKYSSAYNEFVSRNILAPHAFAVSPDGLEFEFSNGAVLGNGSVPNSSLEVVRDGTNGYDVSVKADSLKSLLKVGDTLGLYLYDEHENKWEDDYLILTADDVAALKADEAISFPSMDGTAARGACYWISADKRKSNSPILDRIN